MMRTYMRAMLAISLRNFIGSQRRQYAWSRYKHNAENLHIGKSNFTIEISLRNFAWFLLKVSICDFMIDL